MAKELPYFKFEPSEWMMGRIQKRSVNAQLAFINLCCKYWHKLGIIEIESARLDFGKSEIDELIEHQIIKTTDKYLKIEFLDSQFDEINQFSKKQSIRGKLSAQKRSTLIEPNSTTVQPPFNHRSTTVQPIREDKIIEDKIREDERKENSYKENAGTETKEAEKKNQDKTVKPIQLSNVARFESTLTDQQNVYKFARSVGKIRNMTELKHHTEIHNNGIALSKPGCDYKTWLQYFRYYFENLKVNGKIETIAKEEPDPPYLKKVKFDENGKPIKN